MGNNNALPVTFFHRAYPLKVLLTVLSTEYLTYLTKSVKAQLMDISAFSPGSPFLHSPPPTYQSYALSFVPCSPTLVLVLYLSSTYSSITHIRSQLHSPPQLPPLLYILSRESSPRYTSNTNLLESWSFLRSLSVSRRAHIRKASCRSSRGFRIAIVLLPIVLARKTRKPSLPLRLAPFLCQQGNFRFSKIVND